MSYIKFKWLINLLSPTSLYRRKDAAYYLIKAGLWTKSHEVIMKYIAADAIVNGKIDAFYAALLNYVFTVIAYVFGNFHVKTFMG